MIRRARARRTHLARLEQAWPEGLPFDNVRLLRAKPAKTVLALDSARGPVVASFFGSQSLDQRPEGVAAAHELLTERLPAGAVPALIAHVEQADLVISEQVRGQTAADLIRADSTSSDAAIRAAALWLTTLHDLVERPDAAHDFTGRVKVATVDAPPAMGAEIARLARELTGLPVRQVKFHNDYKPDNVVIADGRTCAIDFRNTRFRPASVDAAQFLTRAAIYALSVRDPGPVNRIGLPLSVTQPFDEAYGRAISAEPMTEMFILTNILLADIKRASRPATRRLLLSRRGQHGRGLRKLLSLSEAALTPTPG